MLLKQACLFGINYAIWMQLKCPYIGMTIVLIYEWLIATPCNDGQLKYPFESLVKKIINLIESRLLLPEELFQIVFFCRVFFSAAGYLFIGSFDFCLCRQMFAVYCCSRLCRYSFKSQWRIQAGCSKLGRTLRFSKLGAICRVCSRQNPEPC